MKKNRSKTALFRVFVSLSVLLGTVFVALPAFAETLSVSGADTFYTADSADDAVDILTVTGQTGDTVYVNMERRDGEGAVTLASHLAFKLSDENAEVDANGDMVGVVSVEFNASAFSYDESYSIEVFADRNETQQLYAGTVSTLFAQCGTNAVQPLAVRTIGKSDADRPFAVPATLTAADGITYKLSSEEPQEVDGKQCYRYEEAQELDASAEGHVYYYDVANPTGDPIKTETFTLAQGSSQEVAIKSIISADNTDTLYRTLQLMGKVTLAYPGTTDYSIMCKELSSNWNEVDSFYTATILSTDTEGNSLGIVRKVIVDGEITYTAPTNLYVMSDGVVQEYEIANKAEAVLKLKPGDAEGSKEYAIVYQPVSDDAERTWTVVLENGSVSPKDANRVLKRITYRGRPGASAVHKIQKDITVDGVDYVLAAAPENEEYDAEEKAYRHPFAVGNMKVEQTIYYVPDGYVAPEAYNITVKYVNIATNQTITSETYTASPSMRQDLEISSPESFSQGGIEWIRLNGQESPIRHGFYSNAREYVVYYRDVNDDLHATTVIRTVRVVYVDEDGNTITRPTTVVNNGTTNNGETTTEGAEGAEGTEGAEGAADAQNADDAIEVGLATNQNILAINSEDGDALVDEEGQDIGTVIIDDDETPLASLDEEDAAEKINTKTVAAGGAVAAVAAGAILFFVFKRRKQNSSESSDDVSAQ